MDLSDKTYILVIAGFFLKQHLMQDHKLDAKKAAIECGTIAGELSRLIKDGTIDKWMKESKV